MPSASVKEPDEVAVEKVLDSITARGFKVLNVTEAGIILVSEDTMSFRDVIILPAGEGDYMPTKTLKENIKDTRINWNDIFPECI